MRWKVLYSVERLRGLRNFETGVTKFFVVEYWEESGCRGDLKLYRSLRCVRNILE